MAYCRVIKFIYKGRDMVLENYSNKKEIKRAIINYLVEHGKGTAREIHEANFNIPYKDIVRALKQMNGKEIKSKREGSTRDSKTWRLV